MNMLLERIESEGLAHYSYLIGNEGEAIVIDPRRDCDIYVDMAQRRDYRITHILETHRNEDYVIGSLELAARTGAEVWHADRDWPYQYGRPVQDQQTWHLGRLVLEAIHAPGHTPGMMAYLLHDYGGAPWVLFSGDALFAGSVGRVDLLGKGQTEEMASLLYHSLFHKLLPLGDGVILCPAHGAGSACGAAIAQRPWTTIGLEKALNPLLQIRDRLDFIAHAAQDLERPPYFQRMEAVNVQGPPIIGPLPAAEPLSPAAFAAQIEAGALVLDTRMDLGFNAAHVPGALSIWLGGLPSFAGWFLPYDRPLLLVTEEADPTPAMRDLLRMDYVQIAGHLAGGMLAWHMAGRESDSVAMVTVQELCRRLDAGEAPWLLDVRSPEELERQGRIPGAHSIHITQLPAHLVEVPREQPVYIFCGSGLRSTIAASLLQREGWDNETVVLGGFAGWQSCTHPIEGAQAPVESLEATPNML